MHYSLFNPPLPPRASSSYRSGVRGGTPLRLDPGSACHEWKFKQERQRRRGEGEKERIARQTGQATGQGGQGEKGRGATTQDPFELGPDEGACVVELKDVVGLTICASSFYAIAFLFVMNLNRIYPRATGCFHSLFFLSNSRINSTLMSTLILTLIHQVAIHR